MVGGSGERALWLLTICISSAIVSSQQLRYSDNGKNIENTSIGIDIACVALVRATLTVVSATGACIVERNYVVVTAGISNIWE